MSGAVKTEKPFTYVVSLTVCKTKCTTRNPIFLLLICQQHCKGVFDFR